MSTIFTIGEIAKLFNISTQALRLYDRIDLLKPAYINEETGYRYYSIGQFVNLECIKRCKAMGFSLDEIKDLIDNDSSIEAMLELTRKQKHSIRQKIEELEKIENQINMLESKINDSLKVSFNKIQIVENNERVFSVYKEGYITQQQLEVSSRDVILAMGEKYEMLKHDLSFTISYEDMVKDNKVVYKCLSVEIDKSKEIDNSMKQIKLPAGKYITMYFDDSSIDNRKYYRKIIDFIAENNIEVVGDFLETAMILRVNKDGKENTLAKLEILCK